MPLYEYACETCQGTFEQTSCFAESHQKQCPLCGNQRTKKVISRFLVGGRGDLRETTLHGCHDCHVESEQSK